MPAHRPQKRGYARRAGQPYRDAGQGQPPRNRAAPPGGRAGYLRIGRPRLLACRMEEVERFLREADLRAEAQRYPKLRQYAAAAKGLRVIPVRAHVRRVGPKDIEGQVRF